MCEGWGLGVKFLVSEDRGFRWRLGRALWSRRFWGVAILSSGVFTIKLFIQNVPLCFMHCLHE